MRALVVIQDGLVLRIRRGGIDLARNPLPRQIAVFGIELVTESCGGTLEVLRSRLVKSAEEYSTMKAALLIDVGAIAANPIRQIDLVGGWLED